MAKNKIKILTQRKVTHVHKFNKPGLKTWPLVNKWPNYFRENINVKYY